MGSEQIFAYGQMSLLLLLEHFSLYTNNHNTINVVNGIAIKVLALLSMTNGYD